MGTHRPAKHTRAMEIYDHLFDLFAAEPEIDMRALLDGGRQTNDYNDYIIFFGYSPNTDQMVTVARTAPDGLAANDEETITIGLLFAATNPKDDMRAAKARVREKFAALERVVTRQPNLGLSGVTATIAGQVWLPLHTDKGAEFNLTVDVQIKALL
jgi:hypothetical protein